MKGTPFKTRRRQLFSPFMLADPSLSGINIEEQEEVLQEPVIAETPQEPSIAAEQMQVATPEPVVVDDKDKELAERYKKRNIKYDAKLKETEEYYWGDSIEDINESIGGAFNADGSITLTRGRYDAPPKDTWGQTLTPEEMFDSTHHKYKGDTEYVLGEQQGTYYTGKGISKSIFSYGTIETTKRPNKEGGYDDTFTETINITAKNHPLYGNTYTRTSTRNPDRKTMKPLNDLGVLLSDYDIQYFENMPREKINSSYIDGSGGAGSNFRGIGLPGVKDGKHEWKHTQHGNLVEFIENGDITKGSGLNVREKAELIGKIENIFARYNDSHTTSTKLNKK